MLELALLFILAVTFFIGWKVAVGVQDEVVPARRYIQFGIALLIVVMAFLTLRHHVAMLWYVILCVVCAIILLMARKILWLPAALSGVLCGFAFFTPVDVRMEVAILAILANYLLGTIAKRKELLPLALSFVVATLAIVAVHLR
jgi:hypothetical protein